MMQPADRRDVGSVLFQRQERLRELVLRAGLRDLIVNRIHAVWQINEDAPLGSRLRLRREQRPHAIEQRQRERHAKSAQHIPATKQPVLREEVSHWVSLIGV